MRRNNKHPLKGNNKRSLTTFSFYFVTLTCLIVYIIFVISDVRERDIPDGLLTIYSLVVSTALVLLGKMIDGNRKKEDDDDDENTSEDKLTD